MDNSQLILTFIEETEENLEILEEALLQLEKKPADRELLDTVFRAVHSIKGGAGLVGLNKINDLVHNLENILEDIRSEGRKVPGEVFDFLFEGMDVIREIIDQGDFDSPVTAGAKNLKEALDGYHYNRTDQEREVVKTEKRSPSLYELKLNFRPDIFSTGTDPLLLLLELTDSGVILSSTLCTEELPLLDQLDPTQLKISWELLYYTEEPEEKMENIFIFVKDDNDIRINKVASDVLSKRIEDKEFTANLLAFQDITTESEINKLRQDSVELEEFLTAHFDCLPEEQDTSGEDEDYSPGRRRQRKSRTVRVKGEKLEDILNEIAELLISQSRVKELTTKSMQSMERSERMEIVSSFEEVDKIIRRVQNKVMNASMIPISGTFTRMERLVRDLAKKYDKEIELEINGRETELDRKIIEQLADPLKHLIRNSVDHGIEPPRKRVDKG
ncbi:MAG: Hpt domain-containing protein, partial [Halanaerobiales bacterium]